MPTPTYDLIASNVLGTATATVTFSSIPATYRDLILVTTPISASGTQYPTFRINGDTGSNYSWVVMSGTGSAAQSFTSSGTSANSTQNAGVGTSAGFIGIYQFLDYSATDKHKTILYRSNNPNIGAGTDAFAARWANTAAINSIAFTASANYAIGSTFYLYGIAS